jgi:hypothetical protein
MDSSTRSAHRRVGAAAIAGFLALLLLGLNRGPASANQAAPAATPAPERSQPQQTPGFGGEGRGPRRGFRGGGGPGFGGGDPGSEPGFGGGDQGGGGIDPAPSTPTTPSAPDSRLTTT